MSIIDLWPDEMGMDVDLYHEAVDLYLQRSFTVVALPDEPAQPKKAPRNADDILFEPLPLKQEEPKSEDKHNPDEGLYDPCYDCCCLTS